MRKIFHALGAFGLAMTSPAVALAKHTSSLHDDTISTKGIIVLMLACMWGVLMLGVAIWLMVDSDKYDR